LGVGGGEEGGFGGGGGGGGGGGVNAGANGLSEVKKASQSDFQQKTFSEVFRCGESDGTAGFLTLGMRFSGPEQAR